MSGLLLMFIMSLSFVDIWCHFGVYLLRLRDLFGTVLNACPVTYMFDRFDCL